ncbi:hypothetical protein BAE44_0006201 [Dichanthelium oligosanthes]|uniref:BED-type domain-containing protein n=1 Tax=Dichanthelium oligosanthes TaxID=888268 RepID=A0A1E5W649_9POAL|nr:hypothetical protein BAE44_0006201 [Dichanthelium oligosanthes]
MQVTMATVRSQSQQLEVGGSSGGPPSISTSATKRKRPPVMDQRRDPTAKRVKSPTAGNQHKSVTSSQLKRSAETSKQKQSAAKGVKPPMAGKKLTSPVVTRSPMVTRPSMMRLVISPVVMGPRSPAHSLRSSPAFPSCPEERSLSPTASPPQPPSFGEGTTQNLGSTSVRNKPRKLKYEIWNDMDPIYHDGKVVQARCKHCNEVFSAARNSGNSHMRRHLNV